MIAIISLLISGLALLVSVVTFTTNKSKHNLQQLQTQYQLFCNKFQAFLNLGNYQGLINFKYDLENMAMLDSSNINCWSKFNDLQKESSKNIDLCRNAYIELVETLDFLEVTGNYSIKKNECANSFTKWLNEVVNDYYLYLHTYNNMMYDINQIVRAAQQGILESDAFKKIDDHYENIYKIVNMREALLVLKKEMTGKFGALSVKDVSFFRKNESAIEDLEKFFSSFIVDYGIDDLIQKNDYNKISKINVGFNDSFRDSINEEKGDFKVFINMLIKRNRI